jgi:hypothetical protein
MGIPAENSEHSKKKTPKSENKPWNYTIVASSSAVTFSDTSNG